MMQDGDESSISRTRRPKSILVIEEMRVGRVLKDRVQEVPDNHLVK